MSIPVLSQKLSLEAAQSAGDGAGGMVQSWVSLGILWAEVKARSGRESEGEGGPVSSVSYRITVRAAPAGSTRRPVPGQRFRQNNRSWAIHAVTEADPLGRYLTCVALEEVMS